jgi:Lanthionine synthetase C-like protein
VLYGLELHEPLTDVPWDAERARTAIRAIVADADRAYDAEGFWAAQEWDAYEARLPMKNLFVGAGGLAWALDRLRRDGHAETALDLTAVAGHALTRYREEPDLLQSEELPEPTSSSLFMGEAGLVLIAWLLEPSDELATELLTLVRRNIGNAANELMWGVPGTLLAARALYARTREERWRAAVEESERALRDERDDEGLWTQTLYGNSARILGPIHGFVGNIAALADSRGAADVLARTAIVDEGHANWPSSLGSEKIPRLQWCHGAPGIIATASGYLDEELLLGGAELIWDAGPPHAEEKGAGLCHGTAGNGYALLKTFERTGDEQWLDRARAFAMHALGQVEQLPSRYSLFTGGIGAALYAADCLDARARFPIVDGMDTA